MTDQDIIDAMHRIERELTALRYEMMRRLTSLRQQIQERDNEILELGDREVEEAFEECSKPEEDQDGAKRS